MIKVASYCRVSTDKEDQSNSFESQQRFFREYIARNPHWELYSVYADEGITGTSTRKRVQFNRMMNDAYNRKFQLIITKEVSRFSRNILDTISYTRELKALGIEVIFMSDGFSTLDPDAELRLSIMGSIAQEESRKTSTRVKWGQTRQMEKGVVFGTSMLGYDVRNGKLTVNPNGAEIVKLIFHKYGVEKKGITIIARELQDAGYKTYTGNSSWSSSHLLKILKNEKYVGDLVQKKTITPDYLSHAKKYNHGEEELVILRNHHEPIISRDLWAQVQEEIGKRNRNNHLGTAHSVRYLFSGKIICGECGASFISRRKTRKDGTSYQCWGCFTASRDGRQKADRQGKIIGCDVGRQIRNDLAVDMLKYVLQTLNVDTAWLIRNIVALVESAVQYKNGKSATTEQLLNNITRIDKKKIKAIDAFLSGQITEDELAQVKAHYDTERKIVEVQLMASNHISEKSSEQVIQELTKAVESIITCKQISEPYFKTLLEYMKIYKDGTIEVKLNQLPNVWRFRLYKA